MVWAWGLALFFAGVVVGGFLWVPVVTQHMEHEFKMRMARAARYRDAGEQRHDDGGRTGGA